MHSRRLFTKTTGSARRASINPQANVPFRELPEFMKMSNRWRADHTPLLLELAGLHLARGVHSPSVIALSEEQIELLAQLEHRRYTIERRLVECRFGSVQRQGARMPQWDDLSDEQKIWERKEIARLPEIMAGLGIETPSRFARCAFMARVWRAPQRNSTSYSPLRSSFIAT